VVPEHVGVPTSRCRTARRSPGPATTPPQAVPHRPPFRAASGCAEDRPSPSFVNGSDGTARSEVVHDGHGPAGSRSPWASAAARRARTSSQILRTLMPPSSRGKKRPWNCALRFVESAPRPPARSRACTRARREAPLRPGTQGCSARSAAGRPARVQPPGQGPRRYRRFAASCFIPSRNTPMAFSTSPVASSAKPMLRWSVGMAGFSPRPAP